MEPHFGKADDPSMSSKADETWHVLDFVVGLLEQHRVGLPGVNAMAFYFLLSVGKSTQDINRISVDAGQTMTLADQELLMRSYTRHMTMFVRAGANSTLKHHLMSHLVQRINRLCNPESYWAYRDESLNGVVANLARSCHRITYIESVHNRYRWLDSSDLCTHMFLWCQC